jgi:hypothetical protein
MDGCVYVEDFRVREREGKRSLLPPLCLLKVEFKCLRWKRKEKRDVG